MNSTQKIVAYSNPLFMCLLAIPILFVCVETYQTFQTYISPPEVKVIPKLKMDFPESELIPGRNKALEDMKALQMKLEEEYQQERKRSFIFTMVLNSFFVLILGGAFLFLALFYKITLENGMLTVQLGKHDKRLIPVANIMKIHAQMTTPLHPMKNTPEQLNWRDQVGFSYRDPTTGMEQMSVISLFFIPGFKKILVEILRLRTDLHLTYGRNSVLDNLAEM